MRDTPVGGWVKEYDMTCQMIKSRGSLHVLFPLLSIYGRRGRGMRATNLHFGCGCAALCPLREIVFCIVKQVDST